MRKPAGLAKGVRDSYAKVEGWQANVTLNGVLRALLLTEADYETIAADLPGLLPEMVRLYEQSFFNVRTDDGVLRPIHLLRIRFAAGPGNADDTAAMLMKAALSGGYSLVKGLWMGGGAGAAESTAGVVKATKALIERELARRVLAGRLGTRDLLNIRQVQIEAERHERDMHSESSDAATAWGVVKSIMELTAPKMVPPARADAQAAQQALLNRRTVERQIAAQPAQDRGYGGRADK
jgi:hypothetical protein